jgi:D-3-phosphoglycerate dehydrogenase
MDKLRIAILDDYQHAVETLDCFGRLQAHDVVVLHEPLANGRVPPAIADAQVLLPLRERTRIDQALLAQLPRLQLVSQSGPVPHIDLPACTRRGVVVSSGAGPHAEALSAGSRATAELAWGLILAAVRRIPSEAAALKAGRWQNSLGKLLHGRTLGILGYGQIGAQLAAYGRVFGMHVITSGREASAQRARQDGNEVVARSDLFARSDVLSIHLRLSAETRHTITAADLGSMKPDALIVNTARAELFAPGALVAALKAGRPGGAAIDVLEHEPLWDASDPLLHLPQALCTPHLGYVVREAYEAFYARAIDQVDAFARGQPVDVRNPEVLA